MKLLCVLPHMLPRSPRDLSGIGLSLPISRQGTKWTSIEKTLGYDFFTVHTTRRHEGASSGCARVRTSWLVEVAAAGDPSVRLWVPEEVLADRTAWIAGWKEGIWQARHAAGARSTEFSGCS